MSTIVLRQVKGTPLTVTEVDANFSNLNADKLELTGGTMTGAITFAAAQFGTNVNAFLTTPSSANLLAALTDETGTGANVFATSPTLVTPILGTPTSGTLTSCTGLPLTTGVTGTLAVANGGTGVTTSTGSGNNVLSTSPTLVTPILGTPASGNFSTGTFTWPTFNQNTSGTAAGLSATLLSTSGGTGTATTAVGDLLQGATTNTWSKLAAVAVGNVLLSGGVGTASTWGKIGLTTHISGTLAVGNGGTGVTTSTGTGSTVLSVSPTFTGTLNAANISYTGALTSTIATGTAPFTVTSTTPVTNLSIGGNAATVTTVTAANLAGAVAPSTSGNVLTSNGTSWVSSTPTAGGSGLFNTSISASVGYAVTTSSAAAFTAPATASRRYIVHSIHVTNIGTVAANITTELTGTTYSSGISLSNTLPVPVGGAVELLKKPKVMQPSDVINMLSSVASTLHATIIYETSTDVKYFGSGVDVIAGATYTDLYTMTADSVLESVLVVNDSIDSDSKVTLVWTNGSNVIQGYYAYDFIIALNSTVELLEKPKFVTSGYKLRIQSNVGNRVEAIVAGKTV